MEGRTMEPRTRRAAELHGGDGSSGEKQWSGYEQTSVQQTSEGHRRRQQAWPPGSDSASAGALKRRRGRQGSGRGEGAGFGWLSLACMFGLAYVLFWSDFGGRLAAWAAGRHYQTVRQLDPNPLPSLEDDPEVVDIFSKLLTAESDFGELVKNFEGGVEDFGEFSAKLKLEADRRREEEEALDARYKELSYDREMAQERMADEEVQVEGLFLSRDNAAQETLIAQHDADDLGRQRYEIHEILEAAGSPLGARYFVEDNGTVHVPPSVSVSFSAAISVDQQGGASVVLDNLVWARSPSIVRWEPPDFDEPVLVAAWQEAGQDSSLGGAEGASGQSLYWAYSYDDGNNWEFPQRAVHSLAHALWTPELHVDGEGVLWVFFTRSNVCFQEQGWAPGGDVMVSKLRRLRNDAWSRPMMVMEQQTGRPPFMLGGPPSAEGGVIALPFYMEHKEGPNRCATGSEIEDVDTGTVFVSSAGVIVSQDGGGSWELPGLAPDVGVPLMGGAVLTVPAPAALDHMVVYDELILFLHSSDGAIFRTSSMDLGHTWSWPDLLEVPTPASRVAVMLAKPGNLLVMAFNNFPIAGHIPGQAGGCRNCKPRLSVAVSRDLGAHWSLSGVVDASARDGTWVSQPALVQLSDTELGVAYSKTYTNAAEEAILPGIYFARLDAASVTGSQLPVVAPHKAVKMRQTTLTLTVDHFLRNQRHNELLRLRINDVPWSDVAKRIYHRYQIPGVERAQHLARNTALRHYFGKSLASRLAGGNKPEDKDKKWLQTAHRPRDSELDSIGTDNIGKVDLKAAREEEGDEVAGKVKGKRHRRGGVGNLVDDRTEDEVAAEDAAEARVVAEEEAAANLCVDMPCCRDYGPNCAHIPKCDARICATRPCCHSAA